jgi:triosephosphate isomerase
MSRKKLIAGNWKMNMTPVESEKFAREIKDSINSEKSDVVLCVPFTALHAVKPVLLGTNIKLGAQNMHYAEKGAYTGEISAKMLVDMAIPYVIVGHSERREYFKESDTEVNLKAIQALKHSLTPIICIGETSKQRNSDRTMQVITKQLSVALDELTAEDVTKVVIAYEPIWAIGTGVTATKEQAEEVCGAIRKLVHSRYGHWSSDNLRILYGGSVSADNANELFNMPNIDGGLVGGASLQASFAKVVNYE